MNSGREPDRVVERLSPADQLELLEQVSAAVVVLELIVTGRAGPGDYARFLSFAKSRLEIAALFLIEVQSR